MDRDQVFELTTVNKSRTKAVIQDSTSLQPAYSLDLSFSTSDNTRLSNRHSIVMYDMRPDSPGRTLPIGFCDISLTSITSPIHLGFGDPDASTDKVVWEDLRCREKWTTNGFELNVDLGGNLGRKTFFWKRTHDVNGANAAVRKLDWLHLKMVDGENNVVVARFIHNPLPGSKRGHFQIAKFNGGQDWALIVLLSGNAVLEYLRKVSGWSW